MHLTVNSGYYWWKEPTDSAMRFSWTSCSELWVDTVKNGRVKLHGKMRKAKKIKLDGWMPQHNYNTITVRYNKKHKCASSSLPSPQTSHYSCKQRQPNGGELVPHEFMESVTPPNNVWWRKDVFTNFFTRLHIVQCPPLSESTECIYFTFMHLVFHSLYL